MKEQKPWALDSESISMLDISTQSIIRHERERAQEQLMEYIKRWSVFDSNHPQGYWIVKEKFEELCREFEIDLRNV